MRRRQWIKIKSLIIAGMILGVILLSVSKIYNYIVIGEIIFEDTKIGDDFGNFKSSDNEIVKNDLFKNYNDLKENNSTCKLVKLELNDPELKQFFIKAHSIQCGGIDSSLNWVYSNNSKLFIDRKAIEKYGAINCHYKVIKRLTDYEVDSDSPVTFESGMPAPSDFFHINCKSKDGHEYSNIHATVKPVEKTRTSRTSTNALGLNVYIFGFDSVSRMMFMRKLPKTYDYLTKTLKAVVLKGHNIVGDGTPQALIPMFTGKTETELPETKIGAENANFVDVYPFIWKRFAEDAGYTTLYAEDHVDYGAFQYRMKGFLEQPADHYLRTFYLALKQSKNFFTRLLPTHCIGNEASHKVHFRYSEDMWRNYPRSVKKFAFSFHASLSHNDVNFVQAADNDMVEHLKFFKNNNHLNDTLLMFVSDHGSRYSALRETWQGKLEERLPFFSLVLPPWFQNTYPIAYENLKRNSRLMTSPFDIYPTLESLLDFTYPPKRANLAHRGISLFEEIPLDRTCLEAGVANHWCACLTWTPMNVSHPRVMKISSKLINAINYKTHLYRNLCSNIRLVSIEKAYVYRINEDVAKYRGALDKNGIIPDLTGETKIKTMEHYQLTVRTAPGNGLFEATGAGQQGYDTFNITDISRINKYGDLPHCIVNKDPSLSKYCVCYDKA